MFVTPLVVRDRDVPIGHLTDKQITDTNGLCNTD